MKKNNIISRLRFKLIAVSMAVTLVSITTRKKLNMDRLTEMRKGILIHLMKVFLLK